MITSRAVLFGFIGGCFYLIAVVNALPPLFLALMWLTAGILVSCFGIALLSLYGLRASWKLEAGGVAQAAPRLLSPAARDDEGNEIAPRSEHPDAWGAPIGVALQIGNQGTFAKSDIVIEVHLRAVQPEPGVEFAPGSPQLGSARPGREGDVLVRRFLIEALPSRALLHTLLPLHDLERGRYRVALVRAVGSDVLGLFRPRKKIEPAADADGTIEAPRAGSGAKGSGAKGGAGVQGGEAQVIVGPRVVRLGPRHAGATAGSGGRGSGTTTAAGRSDEFGGTRPYVAGDDLRFVHWKSTARRGEMVVREWERAALRRSLVLWDGSASSEFPHFPHRLAAPAGRRPTRPSRPREGRLLLLEQVLVLWGRARAGRQDEAGQAWRQGVEWSLDVALSLAHALAHSGEPCTLCRLDASPARAEVSRTAQATRAAELLADARAERSSPLHEALRLVAGRAGAGDLNGRAFIVALAFSPSLLSTARRLRQATVVLIDISRLDRERQGRAHQAAWRPWRQALAEGEASLREAGVRVLRLPLEAEAGEPGDVDGWTRDALRALLDERGSEQASERAQAGAQASASTAAARAG